MRKNTNKNTNKNKLNKNNFEDTLQIIDLEETDLDELLDEYAEDYSDGDENYAEYAEYAEGEYVESEYAEGEYTENAYQETEYAVDSASEVEAEYTDIHESVSEEELAEIENEEYMPVEMSAEEYVETADEALEIYADEQYDANQESYVEEGYVEDYIEEGEMQYDSDVEYTDIDGIDEGYTDEEYEYDEEAAESIRYSESEEDDDEDDDDEDDDESDFSFAEFFEGLKDKIQNMTAFDYAIAGVGVVVAAVVLVLLVISTGRTVDSQNASLYEVGCDFASLSDAGMAGISSMEELAYKSRTVEVELPEVVEETDASEVKVAFVSLNKDLKVKFLNAESEMLINGTEFEVVLTYKEKDGKNVKEGTEFTLKDDDKDGIIYEKSMEPGEYSVRVTDLEGTKFVDVPDTVKVKGEVEYQIIDVKDEIKTEAQVNVAAEDTKVKDVVQEAPTITDTVEWVESTQTVLDDGGEGYGAISKDDLINPNTSGKIDVTVFNEQLAAIKGSSIAYSYTRYVMVREPDSPSENTAGSGDDNNGGENNGGETGNTGGDSQNTPSDPEPTVSISVPSSVTAGSSVEFSYSVTGASDGDVSISSSDSNVATVDKGSRKITGVSAGTATITIKTSKNGKDYTASGTITVGAKPEEPKVSLDAISSVKVGEEVSINYSVTGLGSDEFVVESSDTKIATVDKNAKKVKGVAAGTATITVRGSKDGKEYKASQTVTVTAANQKATVVFTNKSDSVVIDKEITVEAIGKIDDVNQTTGTYTWSVSDGTDKLTMSSSNGAKAVFKGKAEGTATIKVVYATEVNGTKYTAETSYSVKVTKGYDASAPLKTKDGKVVYIKDSNGNFVEAKNSDFDTASTFYIKKATIKYTGWQNIDGNTYFFDKNGNKVTGDQVIQGISYHFTTEGILATNTSGIKGIDVSKWNGKIDWTSVKNAGINYVIIRCGYRGSTTGSLIEDPMFRTNMAGAKAAGLKVGVYFFTQAVNEAEAVEEASMVVSLVNQCGGVSYPIFIDTEGAGGNGRADRLDKNTRTAVCAAFCKTVQNSGYSAGVYASKSWFVSNVNYSQLSGYKIWLAQYASKPTLSGRYDLWQYSDKGSIPGISGAVDMNISYLGY